MHAAFDRWLSGKRHPDDTEAATPDYWSQPLDELYASLKTGPGGLASDAAAARQPSIRRTYRPNLAR